MEFLSIKDFQIFLFRKKLFLIFIFFLGLISSCKKDITPLTPGVISGPKNVCPGDSGITYTIASVEGSSFYLWTVPDDAKILSGQGTVSIVIKFGTQSGIICVKANNNSQVSNSSCMEVTQGGVSNSWCREMNFKGGLRTEAVGFSIGNKGYFGTGIDDAAQVYKDFWEYDPALNIWTQKANFGGVARDNAVGFSIGLVGYIGTGVNSSFNPTNDFWQYCDTCLAGINEIQNQISISVSPNPFTETATLRITNPRITDYEFKLYDVIGNKVQEAVIRTPIAIGADSFVIHRGNLSSGVYFVHITSENQSAVEKIIIQK